MTYSLEFDQRALKEWHKLDATIQAQFKKKLAQVLKQPKIEANRLRDLENCYKIKLRQSGYRLVYQVQDARVVVFVIAIGKRDKEKAYESAKHRQS